MSQVAAEQRPLTPAYLVLSLILVTMAMWLLAFYQMPATAPAWVRSAQIVCFGSDENGLPGAAGWLLLIFAPLSFLAAILISMWRDAIDGIKELFANAKLRALLAILLFGLVTEILWVQNKISLALSLKLNEETSLDSLPEFYPRLNKPAPEISLVSQLGKQFQLSALKSEVVLLTFAYAHCATVCPVLMKNTQAAVAGLPEDQVSLIIVTLDPWRDTPSSLPTRAREWAIGKNTYLLSGNPAAVGAVLDAYEVPRTRDEKTGEIVHPGLVYVLKGSKEIAYSFNNPSANWLNEAIKRLIVETKVTPG